MKQQDFGMRMILEKNNQRTYQEHIKRLFAWVQNPSCSLVKKDDTHNQNTNDTLWQPRLRFVDWALQEENLKRGFEPYYQDVILSQTQKPNKEGHYIRNPIVQFSVSFATLPIRPDATIIHQNQTKVIEVCCQPERKGKTNRYALQKSRLRAAIYSYALNPQKPSLSAFIVLHRWNHVVVYEQNIEQELYQIQEAIQSKNHVPYHFNPSCHWFCPKAIACQKKAQNEGLPSAWSLALQNIVVDNVWDAQKEISQAQSSPLKTIAHFYQKAFSEEL